MDGFASSAMIRLIYAGLQKQGIEFGNKVDVPGSAHIDLSAKRNMAETLLGEHGPLVLLKVGEAVNREGDDPLLVAFHKARDPFDLLQRWQRLETFSHSRHRTRIIEAGKDRMIIQHYATSPHPPPRAAEDLLVMGLIIALMRIIGTQDLNAHFPKVDAARFEEGQWTCGQEASGYDKLSLSWTEGTHRDIKPARNARSICEQVTALIISDPGHHWTVQSLSRELGTSSRSLQRDLKKERNSFSKLLRQARLTWASNRLLNAEGSLSEIGYGAGFSDQAHFTREFKRFVGTTPSLYRKSFQE